MRAVYFLVVRAMYTHSLSLTADPVGRMRLECARNQPLPLTGLHLAPNELDYGPDFVIGNSCALRAQRLQRALG